LIESNLKRALIAASMGTRFAMGHLAPGERHSVVELTGKWAEGIEASAARRLGDEKVEEAA
jgi:hypothetical protein